MRYEPHVVAQGEYLTHLAYQRGADPAEVWEHEKNADLREARMNHDILAPGDVVWLPRAEERTHPLAVQGTNPFRVHVPKNHVRLILREGDEPHRSAKVVIFGLKREPFETETDADGALTFEAPFHLRHVTLVLVERMSRHLVSIGHLDPIESESGVRQRLEHLGHYGWTIAPRPSEAPDASDEARHDRAVRAFQRATGMDETGAVDDALRAALLDAHGS